LSGEGSEGVFSGEGLRGELSGKGSEGVFCEEGFEGRGMPKANGKEAAAEPKVWRRQGDINEHNFSQYQEDYSWVR
jgi:hypothetical protein